MTARPQTSQTKTTIQRRKYRETKRQAMVIAVRERREETFKSVRRSFADFIRGERS